LRPGGSSPLHSAGIGPESHPPKCPDSLRGLGRNAKRGRAPRVLEAPKSWWRKRWVIHEQELAERALLGATTAGFATLGFRCLPRVEVRSGRRNCRRGLS